MKKLFILGLLPLVLIGCSNVKKSLGLERSQPDEFAVVERAPLTMPPNFNLLPPQPGAAPLQDAKTAATAQSLVLGSGAPTTTNIVPADDVSVMPAVPAEPVATSTLNKTADADLLSDAKAAASKPVKKSSKRSSAVLKPTDESLRLQQQNINTTVSPVMKNAQ